MAKRKAAVRLMPLAGDRVVSAVSTLCRKSKAEACTSGSNAARPRHRPSDVAPVRVGGRAGEIDIGAVDRKVGDDLLDRALQDAARQVRPSSGSARARRAAARPSALSSLAISLSMMLSLQARAIVSNLRRSPGKGGVGFGESLFRGRIDQNAQHKIQKS